jgi:hypothetical protein
MCLDRPLFPLLTCPERTAWAIISFFWHDLLSTTLCGFRPTLSHSVKSLFAISIPNTNFPSRKNTLTSIRTKITRNSAKHPRYSNIILSKLRIIKQSKILFYWNKCICVLSQRASAIIAFYMVNYDVIFCLEIGTESFWIARIKVHWTINAFKTWLNWMPSYWIALSFLNFPLSSSVRVIYLGSSVTTGRNLNLLQTLFILDSSNSSTLFFLEDFIRTFPYWPSATWVTKLQSD